MPLETNNHETEVLTASQPPIETTPIQPPAKQSRPNRNQPQNSRPSQPYKPRIRIVRGQTPEEVLGSLRRNQPKENPDPQKRPPNQSAARRPKPQANRPGPAATEQKNTKKLPAKPVNGNYCHLAYGYDDWPADVAFAICMGESSGRPKAVNKRDRHKGCSGSYGLFQIACFWADPQDMLDPHKNIEKARWLYKRSGWQPWGAYTNGRYQRYMP